VVAVGKPPNGRPRIVENTIPAAAPGGDMLAKLASGLKSSARRSSRK
jgi:hypothetical protein